MTARSNALELEPGVFTRAPGEVAASLLRSAEASGRRKAAPYGSAMSMLNFFINRAGRSLSPGRRAALEQAKAELRRLYGRAQVSRRSGGGPRARAPRGGTGAPRR